MCRCSKSTLADTGNLMQIRKEVDVTKLTFNTVLEDREVAAERRQKYYRAERLSS